jgi:hypothetical protein
MKTFLDDHELREWYRTNRVAFGGGMRITYSEATIDNLYDMDTKEMIMPAQSSRAETLRMAKLIYWATK